MRPIILGQLSPARSVRASVSWSGSLSMGTNSRPPLWTSCANGRGAARRTMWPARRNPRPRATNGSTSPRDPYVRRANRRGLIAGAGVVMRACRCPLARSPPSRNSAWIGCCERTPDSQAGRLDRARRRSQQPDLRQLRESLPVDSPHGQEEQSNAVAEEEEADEIVGQDSVTQDDDQPD